MYTIEIDEEKKERQYRARRRKITLAPASTTNARRNIANAEAAASGRWCSSMTRRRASRADAIRRAGDTDFDTLVVRIDGLSLEDVDLGEVTAADLLSPSRRGDLLPDTDSEILGPSPATGPALSASTRCSTPPRSVRGAQEELARRTGGPRPARRASTISRPGRASLLGQRRHAEGIGRPRPRWCWARSTQPAPRTEFAAYDGFERPAEAAEAGDFPESGI